MTLSDLAGVVTDCFFPRRCPVCDAPVNQAEGLVHSRCAKKLIPVTEPFCMKCGRKITSPRMEYCFQCRKHMPAFEQGRSLFCYEGPVKGGMYRFKYSNRKEYADFYAAWASRALDRWLKQTGAQCLVPVPMYRKKQQLRGYNQAERFAEALSRRTGIPVEKKWIMRKRETRALKYLNAEERRRELEEAFAQNRGKAGKQTGYRSVLLVDDIYTTGATADAIAKILKKSGVSSVWVLTVCSARGNN